MDDFQSGRQQCTIGFGCASLYGLPDKRDRRLILERAYELGIRHFDVAPIYGLGIAETELAEFIGRRTDISVATKFGIRPTAIGRVAGRTQAPVRRLLHKSQGVKRTVKRSGTKRGGIVGRVLYSSHDYSVPRARASLIASLRALRAEHIDYFLLHEPAGEVGPNYHDLIGFLDDARDKGLIAHWGPAGDLSTMDESLKDLASCGSAIQMPYDLVGGYWGPESRPRGTTITFGFLSIAMKEVRTVLATDPALRTKCREMLEADLGDQQTLVRFLVRNALAHNESGTVLISSTKAGTLAMAYAALHGSLPNELEVASLIRRKCLELRGTG